MLKLLNIFQGKKIWDFNGGIHLKEMKKQSSRILMRRLPLPEQFIIPLKQHLGPEGELCVKIGDRILRGQPLTRGVGRMLPVHSPTSGIINAIRPHMIAHHSALSELSIIITPDGEDRWYDRQRFPDYQQHSVEILLTHLQQSGIAGLGGSGFPTSAKLQTGRDRITTLIINAAECEPYITADDKLMQDYADEIVQGIEILMYLLSPKNTLIGIEDNKPEAIAALQRALEKSSDIGLQVIPTKYPSGGAKQLTKILTGKEVPCGKHSTSIGILIQNVSTTYAIKRAVIDGEALIERVVTLTGAALRYPGNVWARIGTPVHHLLKQAGFSPEHQNPIVIMGGPLMGFILPKLDVSIIKISNCIYAPSAKEMQPTKVEQPCIRCSKCADVCPAGLLPQQLYWFSRGQEHEKARSHHLFDCIECGACDYVCPSNIPLVQYYRQEKAEIRALDLKSNRAKQAKARFYAKQSRLAQEKAVRNLRHQQVFSKISMISKEEKQSKQVKCDQTISTKISLENQASQQIPEYVSLKVNKALESKNALTSDLIDSRKAAVAAAIARVKARKAEQASIRTDEE